MKRLIILGLFLGFCTLGNAQNFWNQTFSCSPTFQNPCGSPQLANCQAYLADVEGWQFNIDLPTNKLWRAPVNSNNWVEVFDFSFLSFYEKCISADGDGMVLINAVDNSSGYTPRLWLSVDLGSSWLEVTDNIPGTNVPNSVDVYPAASGFDVEVYGYAAYGLNYRYDFSLNPLVGWANVQFPGSATIDECGATTIYARAWANAFTNTTTGGHPQVKAWIGVNSANVAPIAAGWTWIPASFNADYGNDDEYAATISGLSAGTYYFASRFQVGTGVYTFGGQSGAGGDVWGQNGAGSGTLTVNARTFDASPTVGWSNLQWPGTAQVDVNGSVDYYSRVWMNGRTNVGSPGSGIKVWLGYHYCGATSAVSCNGLQPSDGGWSWVPMTFHADYGNDDEYSVQLEGADLTPGYYLTAIRTQADCGPYRYAGTNGFWSQLGDYGFLLVSGASAKWSHSPVLESGIWLGQNFPNPFEDRTQIDYRLGESTASASLLILDVSGQVVRQVALAENAGSISLEAGELPAGLYLYQLVTDGQVVATRKMILN